MNIYTEKCYVYWIHYETQKDFNNEGYIGVSKNPNRRFNEHKRAVTNKTHINFNIRIAFKSEETVLQTILFEGQEKDCYEFEEQLRPTENIGWNINKGGTRPPDHTGKPRSITWRENISKGKIGGTRPPITEQTRNKLKKAHKGKIVTQEQREKIRKTLTGVKHTQERRKNQSESHKGKVNCYDLIEKVYCTISTEKFKTENNGRYIGANSKKAPKKSQLNFS